MPHELTAKLSAGRFSPNSLGLAAISLTVLLWAVAANVAHSLFATGVNPLELAGASAMRWLQPSVLLFWIALLDVRTPKL